MSDEQATFLPKEQVALERGEETRGEFWIEGRPETATAGVLRWSRRDGAEIWLIGPGSDWPGGWSSRHAGTITVHGLTGAAGTKVTVPGTLMTSSSFGSGITQLKLVSPRLFLFEHVDEHTEWRKLILRSSNLHEWFPVTGFGQPEMIFDRRFQAQRYAIEWRAPRGIRVQLPDAELRLGARMSTDPNPRQPDRLIRTSMDLIVVAKDRASFDALHDRFAVPLIDLLVFAGGVPDAITYEAALLGHRTRAVLMQRRTREPPARDWGPTRPLLFYARDVPDLRDAIKKWFQLHGRLSPALDVFAESLNRGEYSPARLLEVAGCLETYHRELYERIWKQSWVRHNPGKRIGNRPYLLDRIAHLQRISGVPESATGFTERNRKLFVASRNHFAHLSAPTYGYTVDDVYENALDTIRRGVALMQASVMHRLGFRPPQVVDQLRAHYQSWPIPS